jgi:hypothetical protein
MGGFRLVFGPFIHQEGLDEVIAYYGGFWVIKSVQCNNLIWDNLGYLQIAIYFPSP